MSSFRSRLTIAFALVAVLPLALALALFGRRLQRTVNDETDARLGSALAGLRAQFEGDAARLEARLALLAGDPQLKRLVLVPASGPGELRQFLADQRFLLGLDDRGAQIDLAGPIPLTQCVLLTLLEGGAERSLPAEVRWVSSLGGRYHLGLALRSTSGPPSH